MAKEKATVKSEDTTVEKESTEKDETQVQEELTPLQKAQEEVTGTEKEEETSEPLAEKTEEETEETEETEEKEEKSEETKETEEESKEEDASTAEETDDKEEKDKEEEADEGDELSELLEKTPKKDGMQKRIDKLTAQLRETQEKLAKVVDKEDTKKETGEKEYTPAQLRGAEKKAFEDQDYDLLSDIQEYRIKQVKKDLRKEYLDEQKAIRDRVKTNTVEWTTIVESYEYLTDKDKPEIFDGSREMLNLGSNDSLLHRLALLLYTSPENEKLRKYYQSTQGGQKLAVADALALILQKHGGKRPKDKEKATLKKKLAKAKRRSSLSTSGAEEAESTSGKATTDKERLDDYIKNRKKDLHSMRDSMGRSSTRR